MGVGAGLYMYDVVVKKVHVRYLIFWWVLVSLMAADHGVIMIIAVHHKISNKTSETVLRGHGGLLLHSGRDRTRAPWRRNTKEMSRWSAYYYY